MLELRNDLVDSPLLSAAYKGIPQMLQFLICCGADIQCHRRRNEKVTAIKLAWARKSYENVSVLLDADSSFPDEFDLSDTENSENTVELLKEIEDRQTFHQAIKDGSQNVVKNSLNVIHD